MSKHPTILCIDDRPENLHIRTLLLQQFGCETIAVSDHRSALQVVAERHVDLLLIDYHLAAGESGEDIARDVRVMHPKIPMIMLTGDTKIPESACECVDAVLIKGASDPRTLLDTIRKLLPDADIKPIRAMLVPDPQKKAS